MLELSLCDYSDPYTLVKGTITVIGQGADAATIAADIKNKQIVCRKCAKFTDCISKTNDTQMHNAKDLDAVMPMYNVIAYSDNYEKTSRRLCHYCKDDNNYNMFDFELLKFKARLTNNNKNAGPANVEVTFPLKYLSSS